MPTDLIGETIVAADGRTVIAAAGFNKRDNLLALPAGMSAQERDKMVTPIVFPDSLTQRDRIERRENALLESCGISPQSVGRSVSGRSDSGAAKRADMQMTLQTVAGPARRWSTALSVLYSQLARLNESPTPEPGGPLPPPTRTPPSDSFPAAESVTISVAVNAGLRPSTSEAAESASLLEAAGAASTKTLVQTAHPDWTADQVTAEVELIRAEGRGTPPDLD